MDNTINFLTSLYFIIITSTYSFVAYKHNKWLSFTAIALLVVFICERAYSFYLNWSVKKKVKVILYDAIALTETGDFSAIPKILDLCASGYLSAEDYKIGLEILEASTKSDSKKVIMAFSKALDRYYENDRN